MVPGQQVILLFQKGSFRTFLSPLFDQCLELIYELDTVFMHKACLECGEKIIGRIDKKFCSDYCRNSFNNNLNKDSKNLLRNINNRLRKNYRILEELNPVDKTKSSKARLLSMGFSFEYFTNIYITRKGKIYYFVYDQGYLQLDGEYYALVKKF